MLLDTDSYYNNMVKVIKIVNSGKLKPSLKLQPFDYFVFKKSKHT